MVKFKQKDLLWKKSIQIPKFAGKRSILVLNMNFRRPKIFAVVLLLGICIIFSKCTYDVAEPEKELTINLRWVKSYPSESWEVIRTGFLWSMSYLGASLPSLQSDEAIQIVDETVFEVNISKLGFSKDAEAAMKIICNRIKESGEYKSKNSVDCGGFLMLTLHSPNHYYKITGAPSTIHDFKSKFTFRQGAVFAVTNSSISFGNRKINLESSSSTIGSSCFIAEEGTGTIADSSFQVTENETINMMSNGQLQFIIYDMNGNLTNFSDPSISPSGKPGKCLWCHESKVQPLFFGNTDVINYMNSSSFLQKVNESNRFLKAYRNEISGGVDWSKPEEHTYSELLYITFMEPNAERVAAEWGLDVNTTQQILTNYPTHVYGEFPFLGNLYHRSTIDSLTPYHVERVPLSAREPSSYEPDFF
ncbi:MAG TPA: hypothetical protein PKD91_09015 [Bacteroidia bacterium]|nr:hypothetical protein [Bacteroidia bacterium]